MKTPREFAQLSIVEQNPKLADTITVICTSCKKESKKKFKYVVKCCRNRNSTYVCLRCSNKIIATDPKIRKKTSETQRRIKQPDATDILKRKKLFLEKAIAAHGNRYDYSEIDYIKIDIKIKIICKKHGEFWQIPDSHIRGIGCRECGIESSKRKQSENNRLDTSSFVEKAIAVHGDKYDYSKIDYINARKKIKIICGQHGEFWQTPGKHLYSKCGCPKCGRISCTPPKISKDEWLLRFQKTHDNEYNYSLADFNNKKIKIICKEHGVFRQTISSHANGSRCPKCSIQSSTLRQTRTLDEFIALAGEVHDYKYNYSKTQYVNNRTKVEIICKRHGTFYQEPKNHIDKQCGCPLCPTVVSVPHQKLLNSLPPDLEVITNDRVVLDGAEIDIWIPKHNFGIEVNGWYWHGCRNNNRELHKKKKLAHTKKAALAENSGISIYQFWDFEIDNPIVLSMISHKLGLSNRIYARNCKIDIPDKTTSRSFLNDSHLSGYRNANIEYGLFRDDELVAMISFIKHDKYGWEIARFAQKLNTSVVGGFSKLLKKFIREVSPSSILTFADRRYSTGNVYSHNNFKFLYNTSPNYFYMKKTCRLSRQRCQKHKLPKLLAGKFDPALSETDNMLTNGWTKIYDAGHSKLIMEL